MQLLTKRLILRPFSLDLIDAAINKDYLKFNKLGINPSVEWPEPELLDALPFFKELIVKYGVDGFNSWIILDKETSDIVGSLGFIGPPDNDRNIEIGFGIIPSKRSNGYCYEAVGCLIDWAFNNNSIDNISAKCESINLHSKSILEKVGFKIIEIEDNLIIWELER